MSISIRSASSDDRDDIRDVCRAAFPAGENERIARLAVELLAHGGSPRSLSLVAASGGGVVGHVAFSPVSLANDDRFVGAILAPLGVRPEYQARGIGSALVREGIRRMTQAGAETLLVYGDPAYYGRFGFSAAAAAGFAAPYPLQYDFGWQALHLQPRAEQEEPAEIACVTALNDPSLW